MEHHDYLEALFFGQSVKLFGKCYESFGTFFVFDS